MGLYILCIIMLWMDGVKEFEGVLVWDIMQVVGVIGIIIIVIVFNDYVVEIFVFDYEKYDVIFVLKMDGIEFICWMKGFIWLVYLCDDFLELCNWIVDKKWIW